MWEARGQFVDLQHVGQKLGELQDAAADVRCFCFMFFDVEMILDVESTTARRRDDIIVAGEIFNKQIVTVCREIFEARIGHRLAAARLFFRIVYVYAEFFE